MAGLSGLGPWNDVNPQTYQTAITQGSQLGSTLRGQDIAAGEAKDRLSLAYAQLQNQEEREAEQAQAKLTLAHATLQARQQQQDLMMGYREQALQQQAERDKERAQAAGQLQDLRERSLKLRQEQGEAGGPKLHFGTEGEVMRQNPDGTVTQLRPPRTKANVKFDTASGKWFRVTPEGGVEEVAPNEIPKPPPAPEGPGLLSRIGNFFTGSSGAAPDQSLAMPKTGAAGTPFKEGALIRSKKDGKLYRVKNGEPVPEEQTNADQSD